MNISNKDKILLKDVGFEDEKRAISNLEALNTAPFKDGLNALLSLITDTPDPDRALNNLERIFREMDREDVSVFMESEDCLTYLLTVISISQFLSNIIFRHPYYLSWLFSDKAIYRLKTIEDFTAELMAETSGKNNFEEVSKVLRLY
ncbi:MAG: hypothetical protein ACE5IH_09325, partial [Thermodesulfobacteriota bacterium]